MKISISALLTVTTATLIALAAGVILLLSAWANLKNTSELIYTYADNVMDSLENDIRAHLKPAETLVAELIVRFGEGDLSLDDKQRLFRFLNGSLASAPQIAGVAFWNQSLDRLHVLAAEGHALNVQSRHATSRDEMDKLAAALKNHRKPSWGPPFREGRSTYLIIRAPIYVKGQFLGIVIAGVSITELSSFLRQRDGADAVTEFILYGDRHVLAHPRLAETSHQNSQPGDSIPLPVLTGFADPVLAGLQAAKTERLPGGATFKARSLAVDGNAHYIMTRAVEGFGSQPWHVGIHARTGQFTEQIDRLQHSILFGLALLVLSVAGAFLLARRLARPIKTLSSAADQIRQLELSAVPRLENSPIVEIDAQSQAFNTMTDALRQFEIYVPKRLVQKLIRDPMAGTAIPHEAELTVMFVDIIGYTSRSEQMSPSEIATLLNSHFTVINRCIEDSHGTVDKYIGDAVMAFWGAPERQKDHAARACTAAIAIHDEVANGQLPDGIRVKIAIHTGPLLVGNIGSPGRINYTVIGDTVNVCSRIETLCSQTDDGASAVILVSAETRQAAGSGFRFDPVGKFDVKGRRQPVEVFRLNRLNSDGE